MHRLLLSALGLIAGLWLAAATPHATADVTPALPDLDQEAPAQVQVAPLRSGNERSWWLGFSSAVSNVGDGPFVIHGHRRDRSSPEMVADQLLMSGDAAAQVVPSVGRMRFVRSPDHNHWHLLKFDRYELRRAGSGRAIVRDRKSGFCLGDRYSVDAQVLPAAPPDPVYTSRCGLSQTGLLELTEGISVGYGDIYQPYLEYQQLPLDGLGNGRYVLVHSVNANGQLREKSTSNNSASVLLSLHWRRTGPPRIRILRTCPDTATCGQGEKARSDLRLDGPAVLPRAGSPQLLCHLSLRG
jgi:Lysyl oxidase